MLTRDTHGRPMLDAAPDTSHRLRLIRLAFLAPDLQRAILAGDQPERLTLARFLESDLPLSWVGQRWMFAAIADESEHWLPIIITVALERKCTAHGSQRHFE